jgi:LPS-assembly lipoprotein
MKRRTALLALTAAVALPACGFRLRGAGRESTLPFQSVHVTGSDASALVIGLRRLIEAGGTRIAASPETAEATIDVLSETRDHATPTLNTQGRIREYSLFYRVRFRVRNASNQELMEATEIALKRDISFNESQAIAKEQEEELLFRDMQSDAVQQIVRRVSTLR